MKKVKELMRQIMSEPKSNGVQFSKVIVLTCLGIMVIGIVAALVVATIFNLVEVPVALITACGAVGVTAVVWNLKKSQTENTVKIYTEAYKDMIKFKKEMGIKEDYISTLRSCKPLMHIFEILCGSWCVVTPST